jgi:aspartyl-tRNA(Asn)/glutamyl-tRNA(Gln) amidotransferase subunit A
MPLSNEFLTIADAARLIKAKALSPVDITKACLDRIARLNDQVHAFITVTEESALAAARTAEREIMAGGPRGPLHGVPIGLKDIFKTKGILTTAHSRLLADYVPKEDSEAGRRLANAGAILLGKLATHEFAFAGPSFDLPWPPARNPWNPDHFPAGSSSGPAVAIAAGMALGALGSDTGGSIRGPAALCGVAGLKPTYGRVSRRGVLPTAFSLDHVGPMAWTVEDCAILLQAIAGYDEQDPSCADKPVPDFSSGLGASIKGVRIGVMHDFERESPVSDTTYQALSHAQDILRHSGAEIREVCLPSLADWKAVGFLILIVEAHAIHQHSLREHPDKFSELVRDQLRLGALVPATDYVQALRRRRELIAELAMATSDIDVLIGPTQTGEAPRMDAIPKWRGVAALSHTMPFNVAGYPAISICSGYGKGGLPLAIQLAAKPFDEATLLRVAHVYETATEWRQRRPALARAG